MAPTFTGGGNTLRALISLKDIRMLCQSVIQSCLQHIELTLSTSCAPRPQDSSPVPAVKDISDFPMLSIDMENKENGSLGTENLVENGRPPDPADWAVTDVVNYFRTAGFEEQANAFQEQKSDYAAHSVFPLSVMWS
ncbi:sterile alpha motif domain-containing protein 13 isoform X4 [Hemicordylus capensis]|uniref:sterile alpha motif domain-containing protein 13 isoform X4 n=1 Tax=Hemicordylus capensis TaxID=884348 RepID=UPI0023039406|nr:sterile alpha motif domain-containing protein 13 isoform X4 [Hemicordylus capensis]